MATSIELLPEESNGARRRSSGGAGLSSCLDQIVVPEERDRELIFHAAEEEGNDIFFRHLRMRADGGLHKKDFLGKMLYSAARCVQVVMALGFVCFNSYTVVIDFFQAYGSDVNNELNFTLLFEPSSIGAKTLWNVGLAISVGEVLAMAVMLTYSIYVATKFEFFASDTDLKRYRIWHQLYAVCSGLVPVMGNFSSMAILAYVNPQTLATQLSLALTGVEEGRSYLRIISSFVATRLVFLVLGFLSFIMKYSHLTMSLYARISHNSYDIFNVFGQIVDLFGFMNQLFGLCRVGEVETKRLFLFVFGGADSAMQAAELDRQEAFLACTARLICTNLWSDLPPRQRQWQRFVAMLSFTHLDVQAMVLHEDATLEVNARSIRQSQGESLSDMTPAPA